jgi:hypothetical protein
MSRRRFLGKIVAGAGAATTLTSFGYSFKEGRQVHLEEDFQGVTKQQEQEMQAFDRRQWRRFLVGAGLGGFGLATALGGAVIYDSGVEHNPRPDSSTNVFSVANRQPSI